MEYPTCKLYVDPTGDPEAMSTAVRHVCKAVVKEWANVDESVLEVSHITGGITNLLLKVSAKSQGISLETVTVRVWGPDTDAVIDRQRELQAVRHLSTSGFGAQLIGLFENGMVQTFIVADTLDARDVSRPELAAMIAKELRRFHESDVPLPREAQVWSDIKKFLEKASTVSFVDAKKQEKFQLISIQELKEEIDEVKRACKSLDAPIVFAHNDLLSGNIMYNSDTGKLYFIDFEYSSYNYRGYDIANHFNEYAGFDCDYTLYPGKDAQYHFFRNYLDDLSVKKVERTDAELEELYIETNCYALASHLYWAVWAIVQARYSNIDFDYLSYYFLRYAEYKRKKKEFLSLLQPQEIDA